MTALKRISVNLRPLVDSSSDGEHEEELSNVSNRVQNRIKKLKWQYHEERRAKEQSENGLQARQFTTLRASKRKISGF
jgi:hypothetical protein